MDKSLAKPEATQLFVASLVATAIVYLVGILVIAGMVAWTSTEDWLTNALTFLAFFATLGASVAAFLGFAIVAPLGTAFGQMMLRLTPPGWWQGPATGILVALTMIAATLLLFAGSGQPLDQGVYVMAAVPLALSPIAGALVQRRVLKWPHHSGAAV